MAKLARRLEQVASHLEPGESIAGAVQGGYTTKIMGTDRLRRGVLIATDRRVVFYAKKIGGYELESFPYANIASFDESKDMIVHTVTFFASGTMVQMRMIKADQDLEEFTEAVRAAMSASRATREQPDVLDQLRKLGELRDVGVLTEAEFSAKKADLLRQL